MKSAYRLRVLGRELTIRSAASPERVAAVERYVNEQVAQIAALNPGDGQTVAALALLNLGEAVLRQEEQRVGGGASLPVERVQQLIAKIDAVLAEP